MDIQCTPASFAIRISEKRECENETEFMLPEYLPNLQNLIRTDVRVKITDKTVGESGVTVNGTLIYTVLYVSDRNGALKCAVFTDDFSAGFDFPEKEDSSAENLHVLAFSCVNGVNAKMQSQRRVSVKSRFSVFCEVLATDLSEELPKNDSDDRHCALQYREKSVESGILKISDEYRHNFSEELFLEDGMPEISDILLADASVCVKEINANEEKVTLSGELLFSCLYEAKDGEKSEYICFTKTIPFEAEPDFDFNAEGQKITAQAVLSSLSVENIADAYGEQKKLSVSGEITFCLLGFSNKTVSVVTDLYSTDCSVVPRVQNVRSLSFIDTYGDTLYSEESLRAELRGTVDLISSSVHLCFGVPEFSDGKVFLPANGYLSILGIKESGEVEALRIPLHLKVLSSDIPYSLGGEKLKWFNLTALCSHECEISGGELVLKLWIRESLGVFRDETLSLICGFDENEENAEPKKHCGFTLYFPDEGESVWDVSKEHSVSVEKVKAENAVTGDVFTGKKTVLLH